MTPNDAGERSRCEGAAPCRRGFSLVELVVALGLVAICMLIALALIELSLKMFTRAAASLHDPQTVVARAWLRRDVHQAAAVRWALPVWSSSDLELVPHGGGRVTFGVEHGHLRRCRSGADGVPVGCQVLLRGVTWWRWRSRVPDLLEIDLAVTRAADPAQPDRPGPGAAVPARLEREHLVLSLRGGHGGRRW